MLQFHTQYRWSRNFVAARGMSQAYLLVEWRDGGKTSGAIQKAASGGGRIYLRLRLGTGVRLTGFYGCRADRLEESHCSFLVGSCGSEVTRKAVLRFELSSRPSGLHQIILAEWTCIDENGEQILAPGDVLSLQFSHHTSTAQEVMDPEVEKQLKFLQNPAILGKALRAYEKGFFLQGEELIQRRADEMLLHAARELDVEFLKEAEMLYGLGRRFSETYITSA